jgi:hypothetical protein
MSASVSSRRRSSNDAYGYVGRPESEPVNRLGPELTSKVYGHRDRRNPKTMLGDIPKTATRVSIKAVVGTA